MAADLHGAIDDLFSARCDAFLRKDVAALIGMLDEDYQLWTPNADAAGVAEIGAGLAAAFAAYDITPSFEREESIVSGDLAFERGWDVQHLVPVHGGDPMTRRQRIFLILRRHRGGQWRFARGIAQPDPSD